MYIGDFSIGSTIDHYFTTRRFSTGATFTLAGTPAIAAYENNSTTEITAGITLTVDFDSRTGLNQIRIVATGANGYTAGRSYYLVVTAGTVDSVSVVGEVIGSFTLERDTAFARLGAPAGASISADIASIQTDTDNIQTRLPAALVSGRMDSSTGAMAANVLTASALAADASAEIADAIWDEDIVAAHGTTDTAGRALRTLDAISDRTNNANLNAVLGVPDSAGVSVTSDTDDIQTRLPAALVGGRMDSNVQAMANAVIDSTKFAASAIDSAALATSAAQEIADELLKRDMSAVTGEASRSPLNAFRAIRNKVSEASGTVTVTKEDDLTSAWTASVTRTAGLNPISAVDPA